MLLVATVLLKRLLKVGEYIGSIFEQCSKKSERQEHLFEYFAKHAPAIPRGQLAGFLTDNKMSFFKRLAVKKMVANKLSKPDFISYEAKHLPNRYVKKYKNIPLLAWTVKSQSDYLKVVKHCDNVIFEGFDPTI